MSPRHGWLEQSANRYIISCNHIFLVCVHKSELKTGLKGVTEITFEIRKMAMSRRNVQDGECLFQQIWPVNDSIDFMFNWYRNRLQGFQLCEGPKK